MTTDERPTDPADPADPAGAGGAERARPGLTRSARRKVIGGVCAGAGRYAGVDPVVFRVVLAVLALTGGIGLVIYGIGWLMIPVEGEDEDGGGGETELRMLLSGRTEGTTLTALLVTVVGAGLFLSTIDNGDNQAFSVCLLAATGGALYWSQQRRQGPGTAAGSGGETIPPATAPPWWRGPSRPAAGGTGYLWSPDEAGDGEPSEPSLFRAWQERRERRDLRDLRRTRRRQRRERRERRAGFGFLTFLLAAAFGAVVTNVVWGHYPLRTTLEIGLGTALGVLLLGVAVSLPLRRRARGTFALALLTAALLAGASGVPASVGTDVARRDWRPASAAQLQPEYRLGGGDAQLDLSGLNLARGRTVATDVQMGVGRLLVVVPPNATVRLRARVPVGAVDIPELGRHHVSVSPLGQRQITLAPTGGTAPGGAASGGTIRLDLRLGLGQLEIVRADAVGPWR